MILILEQRSRVGVVMTEVRPERSDLPTIQQTVTLSPPVTSRSYRGAGSWQPEQREASNLSSLILPLCKHQLCWVITIMTTTVLYLSRHSDYARKNILLCSSTYGRLGKTEQSFSNFTLSSIYTSQKINEF